MIWDITVISASAKQPLALHQALVNAAGAHSQDMLDNDYFSHTNLSGQSPTNRANAAGYPSSIGENGGRAQAAATQQDASLHPEGCLRHMPISILVDNAVLDATNGSAIPGPAAYVTRRSS